MSNTSNNRRRRRNRPLGFAGCIVENVANATFCNQISPHQELINKIKDYDLSCHSPNDCINFIYELQKLVESYG